MQNILLDFTLVKDHEKYRWLIENRHKIEVAIVGKTHWKITRNEETRIDLESQCKVEMAITRLEIPNSIPTFYMLKDSERNKPLFNPLRLKAVDPNVLLVGYPKMCEHTSIMVGNEIIASHTSCDSTLYNYYYHSFTQFYKFIPGDLAAIDFIDLYVDLREKLKYGIRPVLILHKESI